MMRDLDPFAPPTDQDRERRRADLLNRAAMVRANGWDRYRAVWSTGEVVGVAALLGAHDELATQQETLQSAWSRWAFDLWGIGGGQADVDNDCRATRRWFLDTAKELPGAQTWLLHDALQMTAEDARQAVSKAATANGWSHYPPTDGEMQFRRGQYVVDVLFTQAGAVQSACLCDMDNSRIEDSASQYESDTLACVVSWLSAPR